MTTELRFGAFLVQSFATLEAEYPEAYDGMCRALAPREVTIQVDEETVAVRFDRERAEFLGAAHLPVITVRTTKATILDLIDAKETLVTSVLNDRLGLCGSSEDLLAFHDGLLFYMHGAVRAPSFPGLLHRFRGYQSPAQRTTDHVSKYDRSAHGGAIP